MLNAKCERLLGTKRACLAHIETVWTDMRPKSLRDEMDSWPDEFKFKGIDMELLNKIIAARPANLDALQNQFRAAQPPNELVRKLTVEQPVKLRRYRERESDAPSLALLKRAVDLGLVLVTFVQTDGGTELGANLHDDEGNLDPKRVEWRDEHTLFVKGRLRLDFCPVELEATIDARTFEGTGKLTPIADFTIKEK